MPTRGTSTDGVTIRRASWGITLGELWTVLAIGLPILGSLIAPMSTVDLAYQIRAGQLMLESGSIIRTDPFTFTVGGAPWLNQQWAAGVLFGATFDAVGWAGLAIMRATLIGLLFGSVLIACRAAGAGPRTGALLTIAAFGVSIASLGLRAQLLGMLLFSVTLAVLCLRDRHPRLTWLLPVLFVAWANLHGSFVIGLAAVGFALLTDLVAHRPLWRQLGIVLLLCAAATLVNPFGFGVWAYAMNLTTSSRIAALITEWQPTSPRTYTGLVFVASAIAMAGLLVHRGWSVGWPLLAWIAVLFIVGVYAERGVAWWALGAAPAAAAMLAGATLAGATLAGSTLPNHSPFSESQDSAAWPPYGRRSQRSAPDRRRSLNLVVAVALGAAIFIALPTWRTGDALYGPDGLLLDAPKGVTDALRDVVGPDDRLFASQRWASWFELSVPDVPVMVDSRIELFPDEVWADHLAVTLGRQDWARILDLWGVTVVAASEKGGDSLLLFLPGEAGWTVVHDDDDGVVYVRSDRSG